MLMAIILKKHDVDEYYLVGVSWTNYSNNRQLKVMKYCEAVDTVDNKEWE